ncbi:MAG: carboxypeptidase regulatory-like domain-containing protein ['Candidatus Kapabacteria' thiocyanatum]|uniref:LamG-like jellyroll fold domain-containing protein n=1 Tax=Candidatus Kapaibacterium thiocyanatum TaxID=1895771 RepID=A0A1M3KWT1_9BACT|nr:carboxypeptidase regulatory-like domain-containing protein ['Candidatus Kapabacteria' thiocyanatum]OJX56872.1 MAG: hypothetical protein BGO89_10115 ['Candidatus Kapabacteria' thiocyanatum]
MRSIFYLLSGILVMVIVSGCGSDTVKPSEQFGVIKGTVYSARIQVPVPLAFVSTLPPTQSVRTDANGAFTITDVPVGTYVVSAVAGDSGRGSSNVSVVSGRTATADILLSREPGTTGSIIGTVTKDGQALSGIVVTTIPALEAVTTNADGRYAFGNVQPGTYTVSARKEGAGYGVQTVQVGIDATSTADIILSDQDPDKATITGLVLLAGSESPIANATIGLVSEGRTTSSGSDGRFSFGNVAVGKVSLKIEAGGFPAITRMVTTEMGKNSHIVVRVGQSDLLPVTDGLVAFFPLDGDISEVAGIGSTGTVSEIQPAANRKGEQGKAMQFAGHTTSYAEATLPRRVQQFPLTVSFWMKYDRLTDLSQVVCKYRHPDGNGMSFFWENSNFVGFYASNHFSSHVRRDVTSPAPMVWHHVCAVFTANGGRFFIDGQLQGEGTIPWNGSPISPTTDEPMRLAVIRSDYTGLDRPTPYKGIIDDVAWYDRALSDDEVRMLTEDR